MLSPFSASVQRVTVGITVGERGHAPLPCGWCARGELAQPCEAVPDGVSSPAWVCALNARAF